MKKVFKVTPRDDIRFEFIVVFSTERQQILDVHWSDGAKNQQNDCNNLGFRNILNFKRKSEF